MKYATINVKNYGTIKIIADIINVVIYNLLGIKAIIIITRERYEQFENTNDIYEVKEVVDNILNLYRSDDSIKLISIN